MSHFTTLNSVEITDIGAFIKAAKELGFEKVDTKVMNGYSGNTMEAEVVVRKPGCAYDIGLVRNGKKLELTSDWWGVGRDVQNKIGQLTTKHTIMRKYAKQGFMAKSKMDEKGNLVLRLFR